MVADMVPHARMACFVVLRQPLVVLVGFCIAVAGCSSQTDPAKTDSVGPTATQGQSSVANQIIPVQAAEQIAPFDLIDQNGQPFSRADLDSKLAVVNFIFTTCPGTCPRQSQAMKRLQDRVRKTDSHSGFRLVSITVDPETDTPEVLNAYSRKYDADPGMWSFLTGDKEAIWTFSKESLGMKVAPNPDDPLIPIAHESMFALVDRTGRIRGYFDALEDSGFEQLWKAIDIVLPEFQPNPDLVEKFQLPDNLLHLAQPANILDTEWLNELAADERMKLLAEQALPGFMFEECREETGITFHPQIVDDQRHRLLVNHYDHGNSLSVADVDNDGHLDLYFVSQVGPNELWRGLGNGQFENFTDRAGVGLADRICVAASFCDTDNDGDVDLFVTSIRGGNALLENDGSGRFRNVTDTAGLSYSGHSSRGTFFDYDRDGLADLYLANVGRFTTEEEVAVRKDLANSQPGTDIAYFVGRADAFSGHLSEDLSEHSILYRNLGGNRFEDVTESAGLAMDSGWCGEAIAADVNGDHWPDLYVCNMQGHDRLYVNKGGKTFSEQTDRYFAATPWGTMGAAFCDLDNDGRFDLYLTDMHSDMSNDVGPEKEKLKSEMTWPEEFLKSDGKSIFGNAFYHQTSPGSYVEVSDRINAENYWPWGLSCGDINADGYVDAFLCSSMCFPYRYGVNSLLLNQKGKQFLDAHFTTGIEPRDTKDMIAPWFSLDFTKEDSDSRLRQDRDGTALIWSATGSRSSVLIDFDDDGDLDIITNEFNTPPQVLRSSLNDADTVQWLKVNLIGSTANRHGLGAVVTVRTDKGIQRQLNNGASGYLSQSVQPLYFGLGSAKLDAVTVMWPDGGEQEFEGPLESNQLITIRQSATTDATNQ